MEVKASDILRRTQMALTLPVLIQMFVSTKRTEGRAPKTCSWYGEMLRRFAAFVGSEKTLARLTLNDARAYIASLQEQEGRYLNHPTRRAEPGSLSPATVAAHVRTLKSFASWLEEDGYTERNVFGRLKCPKLPKKVTKVLTEAEILTLFGCLNTSTFTGARLATVMSVLLDTGVRANELCGLAVGDVDIENRRVKVLGKGQKERYAFFGVSTQRALLKWKVVWRDSLADGTSSFFLNENGSGLTYSALSQAMKRLSKRASIARLHCHLFRHTFAVRYLLNGGNLMALRDILGHSSIEVTQIYLSMTPAHLQVQYEQFSPMDRIGVRL